MPTQIPPAVQPADVTDLISSERSIRLVDVRTPAEFETCHIPGAVNVPLDTLDEHADVLRHGVDDPVVLVCRSGARAENARQRLQAAGMTDLAVLEGGMLAWEGAGSEVNRGRERWDLERQVRFVAGMIVLIAVLTSLVWTPARLVAGFVGAGLVFAAISNTCLMGMLLSRLPYNRGASCDVGRNIAALTGEAR